MDKESNIFFFYLSKHLKRNYGSHKTYSTMSYRKLTCSALANKKLSCVVLACLNQARLIILLEVHQQFYFKDVKILKF